MDEPGDVNRTPAWVNDTVWYQIFPDRFCCGGTGKNDPDVLPWQTGKVTNREKYGGDLEGIRQKLPYLQGSWDHRNLSEPYHGGGDQPQI